MSRSGLLTFLIQSPTRALRDMTVGDLFGRFQAVNYQLRELQTLQRDDERARERLEGEMARMRATIDALQGQITELQAELARRESPRSGGQGGGLGRRG